MTAPATLTTTQYSALGELTRRGALVASPHAFGPAGRTFSSRTLDALVTAGHARYATVYGVAGAPAVAVGVVPVDAPDPVPTRQDEPDADTRAYRRAELAGVLLPPGEPSPGYRVKVVSVAGETKWLSVGHDVVVALAAALAPEPPAPPAGDQRGLVHTADDDGEGHCSTCGQPVRRVPGGRGPAWVHPDGAVAARTPAVVLAARALVADWQQRADEMMPDTDENVTDSGEEQAIAATAETYADLAASLGLLLEVTR